MGTPIGAGAAVVVTAARGPDGRIGIGVAPVALFGGLAVLRSSEGWTSCTEDNPSLSETGLSLRRCVGCENDCAGEFETLGPDSPIRLSTGIPNWW